MPEIFITSEVHGAQDVINAFRELREELPRNTVPGALRRAARWLTGQLQIAAPVGGGRSRDPHPGQLERSIVTVSRRRAAAVGVRSDAYYWRFLERGWVSRGGRYYRYPFAAEVVKNNFSAVLRIVVEDVGRRIDRYNARGAK